MVGMGAMEFAEAEGFRHFPKPQHDGNDDGINTGLSLFDLHRWRRSSSIYISGTARRRPTRHRRSGCTMHGMSCRWRRSFPRGKYTQFVKKAYERYGEHFVFPTQA